jgi:hypothetical protein
MSKSEFRKTSFVYLEHIVGGGELKIDPSKVKVILDWPNIGESLLLTSLQFLI